MNEYKFDVFVSYRQRNPEMTWVRQVLVPYLEKAGLRVFIDHKSFRLGASLIKEMERAVEQSAYTLAVLTPAYLESNFTELENLLSQHLGLEKSQRRLLMIMREICNPRLSMSANIWLDMTTDAAYEANIDRLIEALRQPNDD
ncbi:TIR domain-containing protein [Spirosoma sp. HMF4905]|uniref:TIR domain-containing protein n=1 Tax=Spirosoma arboris TaxID=2682092 RepID=A0A7K1SK27_9BACT|nr:toll/interleukin-1 receptor domain-containing protein [Spirosoma arboris]MVM34152.1 TIR domain-containing protein [Spirosoma arboris]